MTIAAVGHVVGAETGYVVDDDAAEIQALDSLKDAIDVARENGRLQAE